MDHGESERNADRNSSNGNEREEDEIKPSETLSIAYARGERNSSESDSNETSRKRKVDKIDVVHDDHRASNRQAALQSRQRNKMLIEDLRKTAAGLCKHATELKTFNSDLVSKIETAKLKNQMMKKELSQLPDVAQVTNVVAPQTILATYATATRGFETAGTDGVANPNVATTTGFSRVEDPKATSGLARTAAAIGACGSLGATIDTCRPACADRAINNCPFPHERAHSNATALNLASGGLVDVETLRQLVHTYQNMTAEQRARQAATVQLPPQNESALQHLLSMTGNLNNTGQHARAAANESQVSQQLEILRAFLAKQSVGTGNSVAYLAPEDANE